MTRTGILNASKDTLKVSTKIQRTDATIVQRFLLNVTGKIDGGNLQGTPNVGRVRTTSFNRASDTERVIEEHCDNGGISYVFYSYETPIAWFHNGEWYRVKTRMSPSTTNHQSFVREVLTVTDLPVNEVGTDRI